jgi:hypothetical protein
MTTKEAKDLLQLYFEGETSLEDERSLEEYFRSGVVAEELKEYAEFFGGISELATVAGEATIGDDVMDYILENENREKTKYRGMWRMVTGIAASVIIILGGILLYEQQQKPFEDTFDDPDRAYAYASQTLEFMSSKYNKGLAELSNFGTLETATKPLEKGIKPVNNAFEKLNILNSNEIVGSDQSQSQQMD